MITMNIEKITLDHLEGDQLELAELIGLEAYKKLVKYCGGGDVYVCKADTVTRFSRNKEIYEKFDGENYRELAKEYGLSERWIRVITAEKLKKLKNAPVEGQMKLE